MNRAVTRGTDLRIVVEAKDRAMTAPEIRAELRAARENRRAPQVLAVFTPTSAPAGVAPFDIRDGDVYCVVDPENPDRAILEAAVALARLLALASLASLAGASGGQLDVERVRRALASAGQDVVSFVALKAKVTRSANDVNSDLDWLGRSLAGHLAEMTAELDRALCGDDPANGRV